MRERCRHSFARQDREMLERVEQREMLARVE
jgi:hypothetical protein